MPADVRQILAPGRRGLNLRDDPAALHPAELADSLNWRIGVTNLEKRLGFTNVGQAAPAEILSLGLLNLPDGTVYVLAACANGQVYRTTDLSTWTSIGSGFSTSARPVFVQYLDKVYWANGVDDLQERDGTTRTAIAAAPTGAFLAVWRNRLWVADSASRTVWWSAAGDPTDWTNVATNNVVFPDGATLTALATAPNVGTEATAGDGVLVFTAFSFHRITDDSDNVGGVTTGGANVLVDASHGCASQRTLAPVRARLYFLGADGIYSTDGHGQARLESAKVGPLFIDLFAWGAADDAIGLGVDGRYLFAYPTVGESANTRLLELYIDQPPDDEGQFPWMAHDVAAASWILFPIVGQRARVYFADAQAGDEARVRWLFNGGSDVSGTNTTRDIRADATTGGLDFALEAAKRLRRMMLNGRGQIQVTVIPDFDDGRAEAATFTLVGPSDADDLWDGGPWDGGQWDAESYHFAKPTYLRRVAGRFLSIRFVESSQATAASDSKLGIGVTTVSGAAIDALHTTITPLDGP